MNKDRRRRTDKIIVALQALTAMVAMVALLISLIAFHGELNQKASKAEVRLIQAQRYNSIYDLCQAQRRLILVAYGRRFHSQALLLIKGLDLSNCRTYAGHFVRPIKTQGGT